jgi:hypothetical protein
VVFIDLLIWVDKQGIIQTNIHTKEKSKNTYLLPGSNHPSHICTNIPYSLAYIVKRNCSKPELCEQRLEELKERLLQRGYRPKLMDQAFNKIRVLGRETTLMKVVRDNTNEGRVRAVFRFDLRLPNLSAIFHKNWEIMVSEDVRLNSVFPKPPMICYTRGKNIREQLCTAKLPQARTGIREVEDGFKRCRMCPFTGLRHGEVQKTVMVSRTGEELPIRGKLTCNRLNLLYIVNCQKGTDLCPINQYVGETGRQVFRTQEHRGAGLPPGDH